jgi:hypothetical protein
MGLGSPKKAGALKDLFLETQIMLLVLEPQQPCVRFKSLNNFFP